jgi:hypothetical protein
MAFDNSFDNAKSCILNSISNDGVHACFETVGGRIFAGLACLIGCARNHDPPLLDSTLLRQCEQQCDDCFMSVMPLDDTHIQSWNSSFFGSPNTEIFDKGDFFADTYTWLFSSTKALVVVV